MVRPPTGGARIWAKPLLLLAALALGPLALLPTPLGKPAVVWLWLEVGAAWAILMLALVKALAGDATPPLALPERLLRRWVARFAPDPEALWLRWAREAHHPAQAWWCLDQARRLGGAEARFLEGIAYLEQACGPGGAVHGVALLAEAAARGHAEATFRLAEAFRTGHGCAADPAVAEAWYRRSAAAGFGPAAAWLAHAYASGDGVPEDDGAAGHWSGVAARLAPHPPLQRSPFRHDAAPADPLVRAQGAALAGAEGLLARVVARPAGRALVLSGAVLLAAFALFTVGAFFWAGSSGLHHLPLFMLVPPGLILGWQAWRLRREGPRRGRDRLRDRAEAGDPEACFRLGEAYRRGTPQHPRDDLTATLWFTRAADAGHREAMRALAEAYRGGCGVPRDPRAAARWEAAAGPRP